ncbi:TraX family protein [Xanthomonas hortorum]|uniref:TraX family protein n=1 Tax=Xanthomonas hortorum TaxID=56454 RepID=UPI00293561CC|nr:TraX family protein [Xanthomonas hortorum]MDV2451477.1 TraX family protein [Xanthomonas hortorum NBC5720]
MTSGGREFLKWLAVLFMTGDHASKILHVGYVPVVTELGRIAFPLFALILAYNLAQPRADIEKSVKRLFFWGIVAAPIAAIAFQDVLPLNVLLSFSLAATCILAIERRQWVFLAICSVPAPFFVDYQWSGLAVVLGAWIFWRNPRQWGLEPGVAAMLLLVLPALSLYVVNHNFWALLALPLIAVGRMPLPVPRTHRMFYFYYVTHLAFWAGISYVAI